MNEIYIYIDESISSYLWQSSTDNHQNGILYKMVKLVFCIKLVKCKNKSDIYIYLYNPRFEEKK